MKRILQYAALLAVLGALPLLAQEARVTREGSSWVQVVTGTCPAARNLRVSTDMGSIIVRGGGGPDISYTLRKRVYSSSESAARRQFEVFNLKTYQKADYAVLQGESGESGGGRRISVEISISVPREITLAKVDTQGGSVTVYNVAGRVEAQSAGGGMHMADIGGPILAETSGGSIDVSNAGSDLRLQTAGGAITIRSANGKVKAETAGGSIELGTAGQGAYLTTAGGSIVVKKCGGDLKAITAGGSVDVGDVGGSAHLETSGGSIRLGSANGPVKALTSGGGIVLKRLTHGAIAKTAAGPVFVEFIAQRGNFSESYLETSVGDVVVYLPPDLPVTVRAVIESAFGHTVRTEFPEVKVTAEGGDWGGAREVFGQGAIAGGGPLLKIHTTSGNIELRRGSH